MTKPNTCECGYVNCSFPDCTYEIRKPALWFWYEDLGPWPTPKTWGIIAALERVELKLNTSTKVEDFVGLPWGKVFRG